MDSLGPVTLIVKAPNQKIEDRRVACDRSWTVRQLKEHLSSVYPERPNEDQQKLVYFGKLLRDESCLHEVLTQESYDDAHTVHLVCPQHAGNQSKSVKPVATRATEMTANLPQATQVTEDNQLRNRFSNQSLSQPGQDQTYLQQQQQQQYMDNYMRWLEQNQQAINGMSGQQRLWYQACQQQSTLFYMQLQQAMLLNQSVLANSSFLTGQSLPDNRIAEAAQPAAAPAQRNENEIVHMNAQGGVDADGGHRDWLDRIYSLIRLGMLIMLLYFYTTFGRFFTVFAAAIFFYLAQGNIRIVRRRGAPQPQPQHEQNHAENQNNENEERDAGPPTPTDSTDAVDGNTQQPDNRRAFIDGIKLGLTFCISFFTSLIPQNPAAAN